MTSLARNLLEPGLIASLFTAGALINRRRGHSSTHDRRHDDVESSPRSRDSSPSSSSSFPLLKSSLAGDGGNTSGFFYHLSRFFNTFPFLIEIWYWNLSYWIYQVLRACSAKMIAGNEEVFERAKDHAIQVLGAERALGIAIEQPFQNYMLTSQAWLMPVLRNVYYSHISVGVCFIVYTYTFLPPSTFQRIRRTIAVDNAIAFVVITLWRCYPPRMLPKEYGFVDVLHGGHTGGSTWTHNSFQLTIAAMPSLHFGTSLFLAVSLCRFSPHAWIRAIAPLWPAAMLVTIVATANHFLADAMVGAVIPFIGWKINEAILVLLPIQTWLFSPLTSRLAPPADRGVKDVSD